MTVQIMKKIIKGLRRNRVTLTTSFWDNAQGIKLLLTYDHVT